MGVFSNNHQIKLYKLISQSKFQGVLRSRRFRDANGQRLEQRALHNRDTRRAEIAG